MTSSSVRVRFAPSPTGFLHVGGARTALFNWLYARRFGGTFILRIEDTDRTRYHPDSLADIFAGLRWLGLDWDEGPEVGGAYGPYLQSERTDLYQRYARQLVEQDLAYYCYCSSARLEALREEQKAHKDAAAGYDRRCRYLTAAQRAECEAAGIRPVIRLKAPLEGATTFTDAIRGEITVENSSLDDLVLLKSDGFPTYHLANVVDDHLMEISHIMRADEWLPSVPKHMLLYKAFGWQPPVLAHLPLILDPSGHGKLSKRKKRDGGEYAIFVHEFRQAGYLPEALFNFLTLVGWSLDDKTQILSPETAIANFDLTRVNKSPAAFSYEKLDWMNGYYIREMPADALAARLTPYIAKGLGLSEDQVRRRPETLQLIPLIRERVKLLPDVVEWVDWAYRGDLLAYDAGLLIAKNTTPAQCRQALYAARQALGELDVFQTAAVEEELRPLPDQLGLKAGQFFGILRVAATGKAVSPPLFESLAVLGRDRSLARLDAAIAKLS
jgi:glutamyl-tRNA synthetase